MDRTHYLVVMVCLLLPCSGQIDATEGLRDGGDIGGDGATDSDGSLDPLPDADVGFSYDLVGLPTMPANWDAPRLLDGVFNPVFERNKNQWNRSGYAVVQPSKRILIGPRYLGSDGQVAPNTLGGIELSLDSEVVSLDDFPIAVESYLFGANTETYYGRTSGEVFSYGIAMDNLTAGSAALRITSLVEIDGKPIPWVDDIELLVRPYIRTTFAGTPPPPLTQSGRLWVVPAEATVFHNATLLTATGAARIQNGLVAVVNEWIVGVGTANEFDVTGGPTMIDVQGGFIIPGIFNAHVHYSQDMSLPPQDWLKQGVTTMVDVGARLLTGLSARERFAESNEPLPDLLVAGPIIEAPDAGHMVAYGSPGFYGVANVQEATAAAEATIGWGVNLLKVCTDCSTSGNPITVAMTAAIVTAAHAQGLRVMAHVTTANGLATALAGGVDCVTHIPPLSDAHIAQMVADDVVLMPTVSASYRPLADRLSDVGRAHAAGVRLAVGNDFPAYARGLPTVELQYLEQSGLSRMHVIESATRVSAEALGIDDVVGTLEIGKIADLVVLGADPTVSLSNLTDVRWVMKRGKVLVLP